MRIRLFWREDTELSSDPYEAVCPPQTTKIAEMRANTVLLAAVLASGDGQLSRRAAAASSLTSPQCFPYAHMPYSPFTQNDPMTSLFPTEWNSTQRRPDWTPSKWFSYSSNTRASSVAIPPVRQFLDIQPKTQNRAFIST